MKDKLEIQVDQLSALEVLGFEVVGKTYEECVQLLIQKYILISMELEEDDNRVFKKELYRVLKPTN